MGIFQGTANEYMDEKKRRKSQKKKDTKKKNKYPYLKSARQKTSKRLIEKGIISEKYITRAKKVGKAVKVAAAVTGEIDEGLKISKTSKKVGKAAGEAIDTAGKGAGKIVEKIYKQDPYQTKEYKKQLVQDKKVSQAVTTEQKLYMQKIKQAQTAAQNMAHKKQMYLASVDEEEAIKILEATHPDVGTTEIGEDGTLYDNKFNRQLAYKELYWRALEYRKRFNEMPVDWDQRRHEQGQRQKERQRAEERRNNWLRSHRKNIDNGLFNGPAKAGQILSAPNVFSANNPNNQNVFDERGKQTILQARNVFDSDREDVKRFNPLHAQKVFGTNNENSNIFSRRSKYHQDANARPQAQILKAPNVFNGSNGLNFGKVKNDSDYGPQYTGGALGGSKIKKIKSMGPKKPKKQKKIKMNLWRS